jgi:hypothetical protein
MLATLVCRNATHQRTGEEKTKDTYLHTITVLRDVTQCSLVEGCQHLTTDFISDYTWPHPRREHVITANRTLSLTRLQKDWNKYNTNITVFWYDTM